MPPPRVKPPLSSLWLALAGVLCGMLVVGVLLLVLTPGLALSFARGMVAVITTPFILEATLVLVGFTLVALLNARRRRKEGEGWVYLAEHDSHPPDGQPAGLHDAVFPTHPEPEPSQLELEIIEGLLDLGAWEEAGQRLVGLDHAERGSPRALAARLRLAEALGQTSTAEALRREIDQG